VKRQGSNGEQGEERTADRNAVAVEFILHCAEVGVTVRLAPSGRKVELVSKNGQAPPSVLITQLRIVKTEVVDYLRRRVQAEREARAMLPYAVTDAGMVWRHGDSSTALCNFTALIPAVRDHLCPRRPHPHRPGERRAIRQHGVGAHDPRPPGDHRAGFRDARSSAGSDPAPLPWHQ